MAKTCLVLLHMLLIVLIVSDLVIAKTKLCEKPSKTWFGDCKDPEKCDKQCMDWEGADHGSCHEREAKYMCFCYVKCNAKDKKPAPPAEQPTRPPKKGKPGGTKPAPPDGGDPTPSPPQSPSPPDGGQPTPPPSDGGQPTPPSGGGQPSPPDGGNPAPSPGGGPPSPSDGGPPPPPSDGGQPSPPSGGGQPAPPDGGQPTPPPDSSLPAPPPGCSKLVIDKLIAEALANYKTQLQKASQL